MKIAEIITELDTRPDYNFTADDLHHLSKIRDVSRAKEYAVSLINKPSKKPLSPEKKQWFVAHVAKAKTTNDLVRMMWSMLMSGEGMPVIGSRYSTEPSYYRSRFREDQAYTMRPYEMDVMLAITPDGTLHQIGGNRHKAAALPVGTFVLDAQDVGGDDVSKVSYDIFKKVDPDKDIMSSSFEYVEHLKISPYAKAQEALHAFRSAVKTYID